MHFVSIEFLCLVVLLLILYYAPPFRHRQIDLLFIASLGFYGYGQIHLLPLLLATAGGAAALSCFMERREAPVIERAVGIIALLLVLAFFKYKFLFVDPDQAQQHAHGSLVGFLLALPLPIGISFYIFQSISLVADTASDQIPSAHPKTPLWSRIRDRAFYIIFFPQLVAGPIVKAASFLPQIKPKYASRVDWEGAFKAVVSGLFMKAVIADNINSYTALMPLILERDAAGSHEALLLLVAYSCQIYADFAGYSLIALGVAGLFGYRLPQNFNRPYIAQSFSEFWQRWHISLSSWLREYLYIPLGGNRRGRGRTYINLLITMGLGGLWHGAALSYMAWGLIHGLALCAERPFRRTWFYRSQAKIVVAIRWAIVFATVTVAWIFFKFPDFGDAFRYLEVVAKGYFENGLNNAVLRREDYVLLVPLCGIVAYQHLTHLVWRHREPKGGSTVRYGVMAALVLLEAGEGDAFIYFQF